MKTSQEPKWYHDPLHWLLGVLLGPLLVYCAINLIGYDRLFGPNGLKSGDWAAWVQAIGSIAAIAATGWVVQRQHWLEVERQNDRERSAQVEACNRELHVLARQLNALLMYRTQVMDQAGPEKARHIGLQASLPMVYDHLALDVRALAFLFRTSASSAIEDMALANDKFHAAIEVVNARSHTHREDFQRLLERADTATSTIEDIDRLVGPRITAILRRSTEDIFVRVDEAIATLNDVGRAAPATFRKQFRGEKFVEFRSPPGPKLTGHYSNDAGGGACP